MKILKPKVIIYGLGKFFEENVDEIHNRYDVIGYCDANETKVQAHGAQGIKIEELSSQLNLCDYVLITVESFVHILTGLIEQYSIPAEKLRTYYAERFGALGCRYYFHGEFSEDAIVVMALQELGIRLEDASYVDIGANHPIITNNSFTLYGCGACGTLVDPLPWSEYAAQVARPRDTFKRVAVSDISRGKTSFFVCETEVLSSLSKEHFKHWKNHSISTQYKEIECEVLGINDLLALLPYKPVVIFVDAEGEDTKIVKALDYERYRPAIIVVEICNYPKDELAQLRFFLREKGYELYAVTHDVNAIYVINNQKKEQYPAVR